MDRSASVSMGVGRFVFDSGAVGMDAADILEFSGRAAEVGAGLWPAVVLIGGQSYEATVPTPTKVVSELEEGAGQMAGALTARVRVELMPTQPAANQKLRWKRPGAADWDGTTWAIDEVSKSPVDVEWVLRCSPAN